MQVGYGVTLYDVTPPQATTKINRMAERRNGGRNGRMAGMAEWQNGGMADGMVEW